jgi:hypothetical protein
MATNFERPIEKLAALLHGSTAKPVVVPSRLVPSAIYDVDYRTAVISIVFAVFSTPIGGDNIGRIPAAKLKLLQFVALRPWLLPAISEWSRGLAQSSLALSHSVRIRRAFLSDTAHDDLVNLLIAWGIFARNGKQLVSGIRGSHLTTLEQTIAEKGLFETERRVVAQLRSLSITNSMLEGW